MSARGWILFAAMSVIWGIPYLLIKIALEGLSVPVLVLARTLIGAAVLLPLAVSRANIASVIAHWKPLLAFAFFEIIAAWLLLSNAEHHLSSSTTGLLIAASPIIATVLDRVTGSTHRLGAARLAGLVIGIVGVAVLAGPGLSGGGAWPVAQVAPGGHLLCDRPIDRRTAPHRCPRAAVDRELSRRGRIGVRRAGGVAVAD